MHNEQSHRRGIIVSALTALPIQATIYEAGRTYPTDWAARAACLAALVDDLADVGGDTQLVLEADDSLLHRDRHELYQLVQQAGATDRLAYRHQRAHEEPLLALPDVVAWCWARSGNWRRRLDPILTPLRRV